MKSLMEVAQIFRASIVFVDSTKGEVRRTYIPESEATVLRKATDLEAAIEATEKRQKECRHLYGYGDMIDGDAFGIYGDPQDQRALRWFDYCPKCGKDIGVLRPLSDGPQKKEGTDGTSSS